MKPQTSNLKPQTISFCLLLILLTSFMNAQDDVCGTVETNTQTLSQNNCTAWGHDDFTGSIDINYLNSFPQRNMNIAIWGIEKTDGSQSISQADAHDMVEYLNTIFNEFNMFLI